MERGIHDRDVAGVADRLAQDGSDVSGIELAQNIEHFSGCTRLIERHLRDLAAGRCFHALDDALVVGRNNLAAGLSVTLESVIRGGVV